MSPRRAYAVALGLLLVGALVVIVSAGRGWGTGEIADLGGARAGRTVRVSGSDVSSGLPALGLLCLAGVLALVATRGVTRRVIGVVLALVGVAVVALAVGANVAAALDGAARTSAGVTSARADDTSVTAWRWVCVLGGILVVAAGAFTVFRSGGWPVLGARYERGAARTPRTLDTWAALDQGLDPTTDPTADPTDADPTDRMSADTMPRSERAAPPAREERT